MKEKKIVLSVILGVSLVALITALIAAFADSLSLLLDAKIINNTTYRDEYVDIIGGMEMGAVALGIAFVAVFLCNRKKRNLANFILALLVVLYFVASTVAAREVVPIANKVLISAGNYPLFAAYLNTMITVAVPAVLVFISSLLLGKAKKTEEAVQPAQENSADQTNEE